MIRNAEVGERVDTPAGPGVIVEIGRWMGGKSGSHNHKRVTVSVEGVDEAKFYELRDLSRPVAQLDTL